MTRTIALFLVSTVVVIPDSSYAKGVDALNRVRFHDSLSKVTKKIQGACGTLNSFQVDTPQFPLAIEREEHLICEGYKLPGGTIREVAFTFADDELHYVEARGGAVKLLTVGRNDKPLERMGFKVYVKDLIFAKAKEDAVWFLTKEAVGPDLYTWSNPYLPSNSGATRRYERSVKTPTMLAFGESVDDLLPVFRKSSTFVEIEELDDSDPTAQTQINCFGVEYAGFPRKFEARFGDGKLNLVWILTSGKEEGRLREALTAAYGPSIFQNDMCEAFNNWQVVLRKDKPEVLMMSQSRADLFKKQMFGQ